MSETDKMSEEEMEILKGLSEQSYFGDLPFLFYADLIGKLIANYNKEKEKNIPLIIDGKSINAYADEIEDLLSIEDGTPVYFSIGERRAIKIISQYCRNSIPKDKIREIIKKYDGLKEIDMQAYEEQIKPLKELLEEE